MSSHSFNIIPSWLVQPDLLNNVLLNPFAPLKDISSCTSLANSTSFTAGLRQALYWRKQLAPSTSNCTSIFSLLSSQGLSLPNIPEVFQALRGVCNILNIIEVYRPTNSQFIGLTFSSPADATKFRSSFSYFSDCVVIHVPTSQPLTHSFKLSGLPPVFPDSRIHHFLHKHSVKHTFTRDTISIDNRSTISTNSVTGTLQLSPNSDIKLIPHLIPLPAPHLGHALLVIHGRPSLCLKCGQVGHVRRACPAPRCSSCHRFHLSTTSCSSMHSDPVSTSLDALTFDDHTTQLDSDISQHFHLASSNLSFDTTPTLSTIPISSSHSHSSPECDRTPVNSSALNCGHTFSEVLMSPPTLPSTTQDFNKPSYSTPAPSSPTHTTTAALLPCSKLPQPTTSSFTSSRSRKRSKPSSRKSSSSQDSSPTPSTSWADQVEEDITDSSDTSPHVAEPITTFSPLSLLNTTAICIASNKIPVPFTHFKASPHLQISFATIFCEACEKPTTCTWPITDFITCRHCSYAISIFHFSRFYPDPNSMLVYLHLSLTDHTNPNVISYLKNALLFQVPLIPRFRSS